MTAISPTAPRPTTHTRSPRCYFAADDCVVCGRQVVGEKDSRLVGHRVRKRGEHRVGVRDAHEVGLGSVEARVDA